MFAYTREKDDSNGKPLGANKIRNDITNIVKLIRLGLFHKLVENAEAENPAELKESVESYVIVGDLHRCGKMANAT